VLLLLVTVTVPAGHPIGVTVEDVINGRSLHPEMARRHIHNAESSQAYSHFSGENRAEHSSPADRCANEIVLLF
jgi:hypothetical protein